jgi:hypothetical protein
MLQTLAASPSVSTRQAGRVGRGQGQWVRFAGERGQRGGHFADAGADVGRGGAPTVARHPSVYPA